MPKYSVLMYNFGGYELFRDLHFNISSDIEYVYVTDNDNLHTDKWNVVVDKKLLGKPTIYSTFYVRYHPFEYVHSDVCIVMDGSMWIRNDLVPVISGFAKSSSILGVMIGTVNGVPSKDLDGWYRAGRLDYAEWEAGRKFLADNGTESIEYGCEIGCRMVKRCTEVDKFHDTVFHTLEEIGNNEMYRMDQLVYNTILFTRFSDIGMYYYTKQLIQSDFIQYCMHGSNIPKISLNQLDTKIPYISNLKIHRFTITPQKTTTMCVEAILLTKHNDADDLREWIDWHLNVCKFDRIHIIDNDSSIDIPEIIRKYDNITYEHVSGHARQYVLYDTYVNEKSSADWIMPIDDDEYLDFRGNFSSVHEMIRYYDEKIYNLHMLAIRWKHLFPHNLHENREGRPILEYCNEEDPALAELFTLGDVGIKCMVKRDGMVHYQETWECPSRGHVPNHTKQIGAVLCDGERILGNHSFKTEHDDEKVRLLHCRYKGPAEWKYKCNEIGYVCDKEPKARNRDFRFTRLLGRLR